jgi:hypothetical protein
MQVSRCVLHVSRHTSLVTRHSERPHVIVDLNTWTDGHVISAVASHRTLAPVVLSAIGHPGTSGSYAHTHVLVDAVVAPAELYVSRFVITWQMHAALLRPLQPTPPQLHGGSAYAAEGHQLLPRRPGGCA